MVESQQSHNRLAVPVSYAPDRALNKVVHPWGQTYTT
jgi:hypothetical protein